MLRMIPSTSTVKWWLASLTLLALTAAGRAIFFPPWPSVPELSAALFQQQLERVGLNPILQQRISARPGYEHSLSSTLVWKFASGEDLLLVNGRMRKRQAFQVAALTRDVPVLNMTERRLDHPESGVAVGMVQGRPALQTCLVPQTGQLPAFGVSLKQLTEAVDRADTVRQDRIRVWLGLTPNRTYACLLVTLRSGTTAPLPRDLWPRVRKALQASMASRPF